MGKVMGLWIKSSWMVDICYRLPDEVEEGEG